jgi:hypothetical protein
MFDLERGLKLHTSMSFRATVLKRSCLAIFLFSFGAASAAFGQATNALVTFNNQDAITTTFVVAPNLAGTAGAASGNANTGWLKVEFHFGATPLATTPFLDSVEIKVWIEGLDLLAKNAPVAGKGVSVAMTGSVTYVNVPVSRDIYGVLYVHPSTLTRYSGEGGFENYDRKYDIHAQLLVGGTVMDEINKGKEQDPLGWYKLFTMIPNLVYRQDQTPFIVADPDRYPAIKLPPAAAQ